MVVSRSKAIVVVATVLAALGVARAEATTYCVNDASCVGTTEPSLDAAITAAKAVAGPHTIRLGASTTPYTVNVAGNATTSGVSFVGVDRDSTTIDVGAKTMAMTGATFSGITITGTTNNGLGVLRMLSGSTANVVQNARVINSNAAAPFAQVALVLSNGQIDDIEVSATRMGVVVFPAVGAGNTLNRVRTLNTPQVAIDVFDTLAQTDSSATAISKSKLRCTDVCVWSENNPSAGNNGAGTRTVTVADSTLTVTGSPAGPTRGAVLVDTSNGSALTANRATSLNLSRSTVWTDQPGATAVTAMIERDANDGLAKTSTTYLNIGGSTFTGFAVNLALKRDATYCQAPVTLTLCVFNPAVAHSNGDFTTKVQKDLSSDQVFFTANNLDADPLFVNPGGGDFRIPFNSPLRDFYGNVGCVGTQDITGASRETLCDVGAYEYFAAAPLITTVFASPSTVASGGSVTLTGAATDANPGEGAALTYTWVIPGIGTFTGTHPTFTAPSSATTTTYQATLTVTDPNGNASSKAIPIVIEAAVGGGPVTFRAPDGVGFTCPAGDYEPPAPSVTAPAPTLAAISARRPVVVTVRSNEVGQVTGRLSASWSARTATGRLATRRIAWTPIAKPVAAGVAAKLSFPITATQRSLLLARTRVGGITWVGFGLVGDRAGNGRGYVRRLAATATTRLSVIPPRVDCRPSVPDTASPVILVPIGQRVDAAAPRLNVTTNEGASVKVRVLGRVSTVVSGRRTIVTFNLYAGSAASVRAGTVGITLVANPSALSAYRAALRKPGAKNAGARAYVVATDPSGNTRKVNATIGV